MEINAAEFDRLLKQKAHVNVIDVREAIEFHTYNVGGINIPLSKLNEKVNDTGFNKTDEIIVICKAGIRSRTAQAILLQNGYINVKNLSGGLLAIQKLPQAQ